MSSYDAGNCFQLKDRSGHHHLYIILCGPYDDPATVIAAAVNTAHDYNVAHNFLLEPGDHGFIKRRSIVNFGAMSEMKVEGLLLAEKESEYKTYDEQMFRPDTPIDAALLIKIIDAAIESKATTRDIKATLEKRRLVADVKSDASIDETAS